MIKGLFIVLGSLSLGIGIVGIFVPGLPTTSFLLLTAFLWARSSEKLYSKLISNKHVGPYITNFQKHRGMTMKSKIYSISMMWIMIGLSTWFLIENRIVDYIVLGVGIIGMIVMGFVLKTIKKPSDIAEKERKPQNGYSSASSTE